MTEPTELGVARARPVENLVSVLEDWLADAKSGRLRSLLLVGDTVGGKIQRAYVGEYTFADMVYSCELAKADLLEAAKAEDSPLDRDE